LHLDKVEAEILGLGESFPGIENTQLVAIRVNAAHLRYSDRTVDTWTVLYGRHIRIGTSYLPSPVILNASVEAKIIKSTWRHAPRRVD
jgi:hypothetical protein